MAVLGGDFRNAAFPLRKTRRLLDPRRRISLPLPDDVLNGIAKPVLLEMPRRLWISTDILLDASSLSEREKDALKAQATEVSLDSDRRIVIPEEITQRYKLRIKTMLQILSHGSYLEILPASYTTPAASMISESRAHAAFAKPEISQ